MDNDKSGANIKFRLFEYSDDVHELLVNELHHPTLHCLFRVKPVKKLCQFYRNAWVEHDKIPIGYRDRALLNELHEHLCPLDTNEHTTNRLANLNKLLSDLSDEKREELKNLFVLFIGNMNQHERNVVANL